MYKIGGINVIIAEDYQEMSLAGARIIAEQVRNKPGSVLGFATGGTPEGLYGELVRMHREEGLDFSGVTTFNLDEYWPVQRSDSNSYYHYMREMLFDHINASDKNINIPDGEAADAGAECVSYEKRIRAAGGIDLQLLGIGNNGHIAFNEPGDFFEPYTHVIDLTPETVNANARFFENADAVPKKALTMGIQSVMSAKKLLFLASGAAKAAIIRETLTGKIRSQVPASVLRLHHDVTFALTADAAAEIKQYIN